MVGEVEEIKFGLMKYIIFTILFFACIKISCQEVIKTDDIIFDDGNAYNKITNKIFTGIAQVKNKKDHIKFEEFYTNGRLTKTLLYFNISDKQIVCDETIINPETGKKSKHIGYSSNGKKYWITNFDENQNKKDFTVYENEILNLHQEYNNKKKHGKWFSINKKGQKCEMEYDNGKIIKECLCK